MVYKKTLKVLSNYHNLIFHGLDVFLRIWIVIMELNATISILLFTQLFVIHAL